MLILTMDAFDLSVIQYFLNFIFFYILIMCPFVYNFNELIILIITKK